MYSKRPYFFLIDSPVPKGKEKAIADIQRFIDQKHWQFSSEELREEILRFIPVDSAFNDWIETIEHPETKRKYRGAVQNLLSNTEIPARIEPNFSIVCLDEMNCVGMYQHISNHYESMSPKTLCITAYAKFCDFVRTRTYGIIDPEVNLREQASFHKAEEIYNKVDWNSFLNAVDMPCQLIAKLIYLSAKKCRYRLRITDHNKNMLSLTTDQLDFKNNMVFFQEDQSYHVNGLTVPFPDDFMEELKALVGKRKELVFRSSTDKKLFPSQVERAFAKASKKLKLSSIITPVVLSWIGVIAREENIQELCNNENPSLYQKKT